MRCPISTVEEFYAHALAIEREAAERYGEFGAYFGDREEEVLAGLCRNLARLEEEHYQQLLRACEGLALPVVSEEQYHWLESAAPETPARELFYRLARPAQLLRIALEGEMRARAFFVWVARSAGSNGVRELAAIMAAEESEHVRWVKDALDYYPDAPDWEKMIENGFGPGSLTE